LIHFYKREYVVLHDSLSAAFEELEQKYC